MSSVVNSAEKRSAAPAHHVLVDKLNFVEQLATAAIDLLEATEAYSDNEARLPKPTEEAEGQMGDLGDLEAAFAPLLEDDELRDLMSQVHQGTSQELRHNSGVHEDETTSGWSQFHIVAQFVSSRKTVMTQWQNMYLGASEHGWLDDMERNFKADYKLNPNKLRYRVDAEVRRAKSIATSKGWIESRTPKSTRHKEAEVLQACLLVSQPEHSNKSATELAKMVGVATTTLTRNELFKMARSLAAQGPSDLPRGFRLPSENEGGGDLEAWYPDERANA